MLSGKRAIGDQAILPNKVYMKGNLIKLLSLIVISCSFFISPVFATEEIKVKNAFEESLLEATFDADLYIDHPEKDVEELSNTSKELEDQISHLESDIQAEISKINSMERELNSLKLSEEDLNKYTTTYKIDVSEKEIYKGNSYDKDMYDHGKELADSDSQVIEKYLKL